MMLGKAYQKMRGVTLLELMIVVVIIGIMAATILLEIAQNQERFYLQNSTYGTLSQLGYTADTITTDTGAYQVTIAPPPDASNFNAVASYQLGGKEAGKCLTFNVDGRGSQTSLPDATCWTTAR